MTAAQRQALQAALAQLRAGAALGWDEAAQDAHGWAARVLLEAAAGPHAERPVWHLRHGRHAQALSEIVAALAAAPDGAEAA